jgi:hypothetical protein
VIIFPQDITLVHDTDDIKMIGLGKQEVATSLDVLAKIFVCERARNKSDKIQGPSTLVEFLGLQWYGPC